MRSRSCTRIPAGEHAGLGRRSPASTKSIRTRWGLEAPSNRRVGGGLRGRHSVARLRARGNDPRPAREDWRADGGAGFCLTAIRLRCTARPGLGGGRRSARRGGPRAAFAAGPGGSGRGRVLLGASSDPFAPVSAPSVETCRSAPGTELLRRLASALHLVENSSEVVRAPSAVFRWKALSGRCCAVSPWWPAARRVSRVVFTMFPLGAYVTACRWGRVDRVCMREGPRLVPLWCDRDGCARDRDQWISACAALGAGSVRGTLGAWW